MKNSNKGLTKKYAVEVLTKLIESGYCGNLNELQRISFDPEINIFKDDAEKAVEDFGLERAINLVEMYEKEQYGYVKTNIYDTTAVANSLFYFIGDDIFNSSVINVESLLYSGVINKENKEEFLEELKSQLLS